MKVASMTNQQIPFYHLEKPNPQKVEKSKLFEKLEKPQGINEFRAYYEKTNEPKYLYWDELKYKSVPNDFSAEECWFLVRQFRNLASKVTPIRTVKGERFIWIRLPYTEEFLHKIDMSSGGQIFTSMEVLSDSNKQKFISRGILEEAIASSQLEGAHTTRQVAKKMIMEKREPRNKSEQMILNNYKTILWLEEDIKNKPLSRELLFELHRKLTLKTIPENEQGRLRRNSDQIIVRGMIGSTEFITHQPPNEKFVLSEIDNLINYANDVKNEGFLHPIIKAIFIHFWFGYLHPFTDGNGRLARALFYWYLLKKGYWTFMYLPISIIIKRAPSQYAMAYIYSEQDNNDITYFYDFHIRKILQALKDFNDYVSRKTAENKEIDDMLCEDIVLNERQKHLIHYLISESNGYVTATSHKTINNISRQTAAKDLKQLLKENLVQGRREGKYIKYHASEKLLKCVK